MRTKDVSQKGFTIVELLIAAVVISVGILAWAKTQQGGIKNRATSDTITTASELAMSVGEELALESQRSTVPSSTSRRKVFILAMHHLEVSTTKLSITSFQKQTGRWKSGKPSALQIFYSR